jgi:hypothetical protein
MTAIRSRRGNIPGMGQAFLRIHEYLWPIPGMLRALWRVRLDPELRNPVWPNGADFDPYVLHEWPRAVEQLAQRLRQANAERSAVLDS